MQDNWLVEAWAKELVSVLQMMTVQDFDFTVTPSPVPSLTNQVWCGQAFNIASKAPVWVEATESAWMELGRRSLEAAGIDEVEADTARSTYLEIVQQSLSATAGALGKRLGRTVECLPQEPSLGKPGVEAFCVSLSSGGSDIGPIYFYVPADLQQVVTPSVTPAAPPAASESLVRMELPGLSSQPADLLMDVEMPVSISFGKTHLPLKDVLKFTAGSVVELNRHPEEAVEVVVNNCVIARGEVVVVDGNYGVRIHEIISRQQRLAVRNFDHSAVAGR